MNIMGMKNGLRCGHGDTSLILREEKVVYLKAFGLADRANPCNQICFQYLTIMPPFNVIVKGNYGSFEKEVQPPPSAL